MTPIPLHWNGPSQLTPLTPGAIHLWRASLDLPLDHLCERSRLLSADEIERADRLRSSARHSFVAARSTLRLILSQYLLCHPGAIDFAYSDRGKPYLNIAQVNIAQVSAPLQFNLSHSQNVAVYALTTEGAIGVDIERIRPVPKLARLARRYFSPQERASLEALSGLQRLEHFFSLWTQKEAYVKATGEGVYKLAIAAQPPTWFLRHIEIEPDYVAAVTASAAISDLRLFYWESLERRGCRS
ncbi:MAG: 4'-phosphopantetheinyl transferase family protein [Elainellaceae cyanobacterium]